MASNNLQRLTTWMSSTSKARLAAQGKMPTSKAAFARSCRRCGGRSQTRPRCTHWFAINLGQVVPPLGSLEEGVATWPEFATCVGVNLDDEESIVIGHKQTSARTAGCGEKG